MSVQLAIMILAAGGASRYGSNKLLSQHPQGGTLLEYVLSQYQPLSALPLVVVTGKYDCEIRAALGSASAVKIQHNLQWQEGIGCSIATGVRGVTALADSSPSSLQPTHVLIGLGDTPLVTTGTLQELVEKAAIFPASRIASEVGGIRMSPAIFPFSDIDRLSGLQGQKGAAKLLDAAAPECIAIRHPEAAVDIDTPADWQRLSDR